MAKLKQLLTDIENSEVTSRVCNETGESIFVGEPCYFLYGEIYSESVDIDSLIKEKSKGLYKNTDEIYSDDSDTYYYTEFYEAQTILEEIEAQGYYYDVNDKNVVVNEQ